MSGIDYFDFCEGLWQDWLDDRLELPPEASELFQLDYCPEPYLLFGDARPDSIHFLTTNPGGGMEFQHIDQVRRERSPVSSRATFQSNARVLADYYSRKLSGPARTRIGAMHDLAKDLGSAGFVQCECLPFHSHSLPKNRSAIESVSRTECLTSYCSSLQAHLRSKCVMAISAVGSAGDITADAIGRSPWLQFKSEMMGFSPSAAKAFPIVNHRSSDRMTGALLLSTDQGVWKAIFLMMGSNQLPASEGLARIARVLKGVGAA